VHFALLSLLTAALVLIQCLMGGPRLAYSFPAYALVGMAAVLSLISIRRPSVKPSAWCLGSALLLAGYVVLRAWFSPNAYLAQTDAWMAVSCLLVYFLTTLYLPQSLYRNWIVFALFAVAIVHTSVGAIQFKNGAGFMLFGFSRNGAYGFRASGMLLCPNHLACFLEAVALLAMSVTFWSRYQAHTKMLTGYIALFCLLGVALTGSRGGYLSSVFGLLVFAALSLWIAGIFHPHNIVFAVMGALAALSLVLGTTLLLMQNSPPIKHRLHEISAASVDVRWHNWQAAIDQFKTSPALGTGAGTQLYYGRLFRRQEVQVDPQHSHNDYLELLAEYGIVGGALALFFLVVHMGRGIAATRLITIRRFGSPFMIRNNTLALTVGSLSAVAALLAHSVVDSNMHLPGNALLFAFLFALIGSPEINKDEEAPADPPELFLRKGLALTGVGLLAAIALQYKGEQLSNQVRLAWEQRDFAECTRLAALALKKNPANPDTYFYQGEAYRALGVTMTDGGLQESYFEQAIASYRKGLHYFPQNENLWIRLGQCLDGTYRFDEAQEAYLNAIATDPGLGLLYAFYGAHLQLVGDLEGATRCETAAREMSAAGVEKNGLSDPRSLLDTNPWEIPPRAN